MPLWFRVAFSPLSTCKLSVSPPLSSSHPHPRLCLDGPGVQEPVRLTDVQAAMELIAAAEVAVIGFFQVCSDIATCPSPKEPEICYLKGAMLVTCRPNDTALEVKEQSLILACQSRSHNF